MLYSAEYNDVWTSELQEPTRLHYRPFIRRLECITTLSPEERQAIVALAVMVKSVPAGQDIVKEGDRLSHCCILLDGWAYRYRMLEEGRRQILSFHLPGAVPNLYSLHLPVADHALTVSTASSVGFVTHESMRALIRRFPGLAEALWRDTALDTAISGAWIASIGRRLGPNRLAHLFCELYLRLEALGLAQHHRYKLPLTQVDLADALGLTNVHVNRSLRELRRSGLISLHRGWLQIRCWQDLVKYAEFDPTYLHLREGGSVDAAPAGDPDRDGQP